MDQKLENYDRRKHAGNDEENARCKVEESPLLKNDLDI